MRFILTITVILQLTVDVTLSSAQPRYHQDDMVTYADSRKVWCVDIGREDVYVATDGGVWRFSRFTGEMLDPWFAGVGLHEAIPLTNGRVILWHEDSGTLWLATTSELLYWRSDFRTWYRLDDHRVQNQRIKSLGDAGEFILVEISGTEDRILAIDPHSLRMETMAGDLPASIRWTGRRGWTPHEFPSYFTTDFSIFFNSEDGSIKDWQQDVFMPVFERFNDYDRKSYICYPGLGLAIADSRRMNLELFQLGLAGNDVKAIALDDNGVIWAGGNNGTAKSGFSRFDRRTGRWTRYDEALTFGLNSHHAWDALIYNNQVYFATDQGLVCFEKDNDDWKTYDRFDGLAGLDLRALARLRSVLFVGGNQGLNRFKLPSGPIWKAGFEAADELITSDLATEEGNIWAAGLQGVIRFSRDAVSEIETKGEIFSPEPSRSIEITGGRIWIGTTYGIKVFDKSSETWTDILGKVHLDGGKPLDMVGNDSLLWIGTDKGLKRFNFLRGNWVEYGVREGLPHPRVQRLVLESDTLWIGTPRGLTRFLWNRPERDVF